MLCKKGLIPKQHYTNGDNFRGKKDDTDSSSYSDSEECLNISNIS